MKSPVICIPPCEGPTVESNIGAAYIVGKCRVLWVYVGKYALTKNLIGNLYVPVMDRRCMSERQIQH